MLRPALTLLLLTVTPLLIGCTRLFSPDSVINSALTSYLPDDSDAEIPDAERGVLRSGTESSEVETSSNELTDLPVLSETLDSEGMGSLEVNSELSRTESQGELNSSWTRIEQHVESEPVNSSDVIGSGNVGVQGAGSGDDKVIRIIDAKKDGVAVSQKPESTGWTHAPFATTVPDTTGGAPLIERPVIESTPTMNFHSGFQWDQLQLNSNNESGSSWRDSLDATISHLREELKSEQIGKVESHELAAWLSILDSMEGKDESWLEWYGRVQEMKKKLTPEQFEAIELALEGLGGRLANSGNSVQHLEWLLGELRSKAELAIRNVAICSEVSGYGKYKPFEKYEFRGEDEVLIYCELEHFAHQMAADSPAEYLYHFDAQVHYVDQRGATNHVQSFADIQEKCKNQRHDFYLFFRVQIPNLKPGGHSIQLRIHDKIGQKKATLNVPVSFQVVQ